MLTIPLCALLVSISTCLISSARAAPLNPTVPFSQPKATHRKASKPRAATTWSTPQKFSDLSPFGITKFANGKNNLLLVNITQGAIPWSAAFQPPTVLPQTALQLQYPAGSINPGNAGHPSGGADFYAAPLDISNAQRVSLEYSVFFPANFSWTLGGKLPGLYGGDEGCSGGVSAESCFSTRLMWRPKGAGELYLYAPKEKQGPSVCKTPPYCDCTPTYGLSIGRGSFYFTLGGWTNVKQTVRLNTPGIADGGFELEVNGKIAMVVNGVYYRESMQSVNSMSSAPTRRTFKLKSKADIHRRWSFGFPGPLFDTPIPAVSAEDIGNGQNRIQRLPKIGITNILNAPPKRPSVIGFKGIFFSTFFGGHEDDWATPTDQRTFFKEFAMMITG
ncbi:hypothetical protein FRB97_008550 [Tulasnella sp. 331]|nr:hypothetical protein FRB97_008550 [Tulasnella sp. 331]